MKWINRTLGATVIVVGLTAGSFAQTTFYFPQIADGNFGGGYFTTTLLVTNNGSAGAANVAMTFRRSDGSPFNLGFVDSANNPVAMAGNVLSINSLAQGQSRVLVSTAAGGLGVGFATVTSNVPITASAIFSQFAGAPGFGTRLSEAAVVPATTATNQGIFVDERGGFRTAFAYANPSVTNTATVNFSLMSINTGGVPVLTTARVLNPGTHTSIFVDELFTFNPTALSHVGTMRVISTEPVAMMSLRFEGDLFTTVPPFSVASVIGAFENWLNDAVLPGPLATFARLLVRATDGRA